jgi:hypothetical protein
MIIFHPLKYKLNGLVLISMLFFGSVLFGQEVTVSARLDTTRAMIGDQLKLHLRVEKPAQTGVVFPTLADTLTGKIEIVHKGPVDSTVSAPGRIVMNQDLLVTVFDTGYFQIPPLIFGIHTGLIQDTLRSMPVPFEILSMPVDSTIRDIKANMKAPLNIEEIFPFILGLIGIALVVLLVIYWIRKRTRKGPLVSGEMITEPADVIALRELEHLREEKPWINKQIKLYYIRLTEILRIYIERRFHIMALEQTTDEILASLKKSESTDTSLKKLTSILKLADLVKFAKVIPDLEENTNQLDEAVEFVKNTALPKDELKQEGSYEHDPVQSNVES